VKALLLSGGIESSCLAFWKRPQLCITVDYGQACAEMEIETSASIARKLKLKHAVVHAPVQQKFGLSRVDEKSNKPEFWPFRNQFIGTVAAMHLYGSKAKEIWFGTVRTDSRFSDGSKMFFRRLDSLTVHQEGGIAIRAPAISLSTEQLIEKSKTPWSILGATFSCHRGNTACGDCPGCEKQRSVLFANF
jgi:7-cyano-7-deazaguanine synthase